MGTKSITVVRISIREPNLKRRMRRHSGHYGRSESRHRRSFARFQENNRCRPKSDKIRASKGTRERRTHATIAYPPSRPDENLVN
jgi:hypothetical protein